MTEDISLPGRSEPVCTDPSLLLKLVRRDSNSVNEAVLPNMLDSTNFVYAIPERRSGIAYEVRDIRVPASMNT